MSESLIVRAKDCRICIHCGNLVTSAEVCLVCGDRTDPHPEHGIEDSFCSECGEGPFPEKEMSVVTWEEDPYIQTEDGDLIMLCSQCHGAREVSEANSKGGQQ